ncbi:MULTISPECIES: hypothetical protein [unclassified Xanthobacter]|uniref:hypothetical protein n=1 Tax=unclassified Xanthobacter TaxID=2623496 RepID=UPI001F1A56F4|nr:MULTISPECIES: hypothetical protein [unclassified Xanthobacter]
MDSIGKHESSSSRNDWAWGAAMQFGGWSYSSADFEIDERVFHASIFDTGENFIYDIAELRMGRYNVLNQGVAYSLDEAQSFVAMAALVATSSVTVPAVAPCREAEFRRQV